LGKNGGAYSRQNAMEKRKRKRGVKCFGGVAAGERQRVSVVAARVSVVAARASAKSQVPEILHFANQGPNAGASVRINRLSASSSFPPSPERVCRPALPSVGP